MKKTTTINWLFPAVFGIVIYGFIRLITDTFAGRSHIRPENYSLVLLELMGTIVVTYIITWFLLRYERYLNRRPLLQVSRRQVMLDFLGCWLLILIGTNLLMTPIVALTDDGLSGGDLAVINVVPTFLALLWFAVRRGNHYLQTYTQQQVTLEKVKRAQVEQELKWLRSQLQPHFLFNALNTIYFQIHETPEAAQHTIEQLSRLLRHSLYEGEQTLIKLEKEVQYIRDYIAIQQTRKVANLQVHIDLPLPDYSLEIAPQLLTPFIENAFKYVGGTAIPFIDIQLFTTPSSLDFQVRNSIPRQLSTSTTGGIGLANLKRRLDLLYPERYKLQTDKTAEVFVAKLHIDLPQAGD